MKVVIQCAGSKSPDAGHFRTESGERIVFVANPAAAPQIPGSIYARPDDLSDRRPLTWRERLVRYNASQVHNPFGLLQACRLYEPAVYGDLVEQFGVENVFILSAGWGLVSAAYHLPVYDITFSGNAEPYKRRAKTDRYRDFCQLANVRDDRIVFFGGKDYLPLFEQLTDAIPVEKVVFYRSERRPEHSSWRLLRFETTRRTNWHYDCAAAFMSGEIAI